MRTQPVFKSLPVSVLTAVDQHQTWVATFASMTAPPLQPPALQQQLPSVIWGME